MVPVAGVGILAVLVGLGLMAGIVFAIMLAKAGSRPPAPDEGEITSSARALVRPMEQDLAEMRRVMAMHPDAPHIQAVGAEMALEVEGVIQRALGLSRKINELKQLLRGQTRAEMELRRLEANPRHRAAASAKREELGRYEEAELAIHTLEESIARLQGGVSGLKSSLLAAAVRQSAAHQETGSMDELRNQLESLRTSMAEAESFVQQTTP